MSALFCTDRYSYDLRMSKAGEEEEEEKEGEDDGEDDGEEEDEEEEEKEEEGGRGWQVGGYQGKGCDSPACKPCSMVK